MFTVGLRPKHILLLPCRRPRLSRPFIIKGSVCLSQHQNARKPLRQPRGSEPDQTVETAASIEKAIAEKTKATDLLVDNALSNREQRKADWTILSEMAKYLWPKVSARLPGFFTIYLTQNKSMIWVPRFALAYQLVF